jgi:hypothetical protein
MRLALLFPLLAACSSPDLLVGTYNTMLTGSDVVNGNTSAVSGTATIAVTHSVTMATPQPYEVTVAMSGSTACTLNGTVDDKSNLKIDITSGQNCTLEFSTGTATATFTLGTVVLTAGMTEKDDSLKTDLSYTFTGTTIIGTGFSGSGMRSYTGPRL